MKAQHQENNKNCNCQNKDRCPLNGFCQRAGVVYQAKVSRTDGGQDEFYTGCTMKTFKLRFDKHSQSFRNEKFSNESTLSIYIWNLKRQNIGYDIQWKILARAKPYNSSTGICNLCNMEKYYIMYHPEKATLNKRKEIFNFCMHRPWKSLARQNV